MIPSRTLPRRTFVADLGRGAVALAVLGIAGCAPGTAATASPPRSSATPTGAPGTAGPRATGDASSPPAAGLPAWTRVDLGFVSAYVLVHGGEAAIVDTGVDGSADSIEASLRAIGLDWSSVGHLVLTHHHSDHAGSAATILERAPDATGYAGAEDIGSIAVPRALTPVQDGDVIFDLRVVTAPGHTAGSICVLDPAGGGILVAGDALRTEGGLPALPSDQFTADMDAAIASVAKLGGLTFETLLVGHGEPIEQGASAMVAELAAGR